MENRKIERISNNFKGSAKEGTCPFCENACHNRVFTSTQQHGFKAHENCLIAWLKSHAGSDEAIGKECKDYDSFHATITTAKSIKIASVIYRDFNYFTTNNVNKTHFSASADFNSARSLVRFLENVDNNDGCSTFKVEYQGKVYKMRGKNVDENMEALDLIRKIPTMKVGGKKTLEAIARLRELTK